MKSMYAGAAELCGVWDYITNLHGANVPANCEQSPGEAQPCSTFSYVVTSWQVWVNKAQQHRP